MASRLLSFSKSTVKSRKSEHRALKERRGLAVPFVRASGHLSTGPMGPVAGEEGSLARAHSSRVRTVTCSSSVGLPIAFATSQAALKAVNSPSPAPRACQYASTMGRAAPVLRPHASACRLRSQRPPQQSNPASASAGGQSRCGRSSAA